MVKTFPLSNDDFSMMREAANRVAQDESLQNLVGMDRLRADGLSACAGTFVSGQRSFWPEVHQKPDLLPNLMDVLIASGQDVPRRSEVLSLLVGRRACHLQAHRSSSPLAHQARRFAPALAATDVFRKSLRDMVTFPHGEVFWNYREGRFPRFETTLWDAQSGGYPYNLSLTTNSPMNTIWIEVSPGVDHSKKYAGREGEVDVRVDGQRIDVGRIGPDLPRVAHGFVIAPALPARVVTASSFGRFHSALLVQSARMLLH